MPASLATASSVIAPMPLARRTLRAASRISSRERSRRLARRACRGSAPAPPDRPLFSTMRLHPLPGPSFLPQHRLYVHQLTISTNGLKTDRHSRDGSRRLSAMREKRMDKLSLNDPLFATYAIAATVLILKAVSMSWLTVFRMLSENGGFRSPEDAKRTRFNPNASPAQLAPNDRVERIRRIQLNDLESIPYFLVAAFLFILTQPPLLLAQLLLYGYVVTR